MKNEWTTSNQDRQMIAVRHTQSAMPCLNPAERMRVTRFNPETVRVHCPGVVEQAEVAAFLRRAGYAVAIDGPAVLYTEVVRHV